MLLFCPVEAVNAEPTADSVTGLSRDEALRLGQRMYREGILPSGKPMEAVVVGDIPVDGRMFACVSCHQRSGMGSFEGNIFTRPTNGASLYKPLSSEDDLSPFNRKKLPNWMRDHDFRPAYTNETLAVALRAGEDPTGRRLNEVMPRYFLNDRDMEILIFYLSNLSAKYPPGVTDATLHLATVVTEGVSQADRQAMLAPLQSFISTWGKSRQMGKRAVTGPFFDETMNRGYRKLILDVWELTGPPESWRQQLEAYNQKEPAFALVGGIATGDWAPIHHFSEEHKIPTIFPITDFPVISEDDWYTLYFSRGLYQEGETAARYLRAATNFSPDTAVVQVFRNERAGHTLAKAFRDTSRILGMNQPEDMILEGKVIVNEEFWRKLAVRYKDSVVVAWLGPKDIQGIGALADLKERPKIIFVASGLLGKGLELLPANMRSFIYITYPYRLPKENERLMSVVKAWLKINRIPVTNLDIESRMYDLIMMLANPLSMNKGYYYRDYLLELFDMMQDQWYNIALYPRLSFGPGQRYASKGCYVVQLAEGERPEMIKRSGWVIH